MKDGERVVLERAMLAELARGKTRAPIGAESNAVAAVASSPIARRALTILFLLRTFTWTRNGAPLPSDARAVDRPAIGSHSMSTTDIEIQFKRRARARELA